ncbi:MAG: glycosyltransferase family 2 protein [Planctomycetia bacterium]
MSAVQPALSVVIPVYNSAGMLPTLVARLEPVLREQCSAFELILINDGSRDDSWAVIERLCEQHAWIRGIDMLRNYGQHNAILCGIRAARHEWIATMDDDLQHPPEELPKLLAELPKGLDVVYGPPEREQHGFLRDIASQITKYALQNAMGADTARSVSAFRVFRTELRGAFEEYRNPYVSIDVLLTWGTRKFGSMRVRHDARAEGVSNYTYRKLLVHALNMITGFSTFPLQLASWVGFLFALFGMVVLGYVLVSYFIRGSSVSGFTFLASVIAIFSGAQLFALGILGEYLARMHFRMMDRPAYAVRRKKGGE